MLSLGVDQHHKQLTISLRDGEGSVMLKRQVSTRPEKTRAFLDEVCRRARGSWRCWKSAASTIG